MTNQTPFEPDESIVHATGAGTSFLSTLARSLGLHDDNLSQLIGIPALTPAHGLMGRDPVPVGLIAHLQNALNSLVVDARAVLCDNATDPVPMALTLSRAVFINAVRDPVPEKIREEILMARNVLDRAVDQYGYEDEIWKVIGLLPEGFEDAVEDLGTVESLLARFAGISRSQLIKMGVARSNAGGMLSGREDWYGDAFDMLVESVTETAQKIAAAELWNYDDEDELPLHAVRAIRSLTQSQTAALWACFPQHRPLVERYSPHVFSSDRNVGRRNFADLKGE